MVGIRDGSDSDELMRRGGMGNGWTEVRRDEERHSKSREVEKEVERVEKDEGTRRRVMYGWTDQREENRS